MPYFRTLNDNGKRLVSNMQMLTKADVAFAAAELSKRDSIHFYHHDCQFHGYEGFDGGVWKHEKTSWGGKGVFLASVSRQELLEICKDRPIVPQEDSFKDE